MNLPAIDIPVKLPFDVPLMLHPIFVHFAIAVPVIVFLLEIGNIKAKNRAVSITSLFLLTLGLLVYAGAFFTGKADGSHAFALLSSDAQAELKFHKLLGTYLVYGIGAVYLFKLLAMLVKANWARDIFLVLLLVFIGVLFKQGKDGGELVYHYGVNVEPVSKLQDRIDEIDDLKAAAKKAKETTAAPAEASSEEKAAANEVPAEQTASEEASSAEAPKAEAAEDPAAEKAAESEAPAAVHEAAKAVKEHAVEVHEAVKEKAEEAIEKVKEKAHKAAAAVEEQAQEAVRQTTEHTEEAAHEAETPAH